MDEWLTAKESAERLEVSTARIRQLCQEKKLTCKKFGSYWAVSRASVEAYAKTDRKPGPKKGE